MLEAPTFIVSVSQVAEHVVEKTAQLCALSGQERAWQQLRYCWPWFMENMKLGGTPTLPSITSYNLSCKNIIVFCCFFCKCFNVILRITCWHSYSIPLGFTFTDQCPHLFQQRISCLPMGASGLRHTVSLLLSVTLKKKRTHKTTHLLTLIWMSVSVH